MAFLQYNEIVCSDSCPVTQILVIHHLNLYRIACVINPLLKGYLVLWLQTLIGGQRTLLNWAFFSLLKINELYMDRRLRFNLLPTIQEIQVSCCVAGEAITSTELTCNKYLWNEHMNSINPLPIDFERKWRVIIHPR